MTSNDFAFIIIGIPLWMTNLVTHLVTNIQYSVNRKITLLLSHYGNIAEYFCFGDEREVRTKIIPTWFAHLNPLWESPV